MESRNFFGMALAAAMSATSAGWPCGMPARWVIAFNPYLPLLVSIVPSALQACLAPIYRISKRRSLTDAFFARTVSPDEGRTMSNGFFPAVAAFILLSGPAAAATLTSFDQNYRPGTIVISQHQRKLYF